MNNLKYLGYGAKAFTISMVETALHVSGQKISGTDIQHIIELGKSLLKMPIELLPGVKETLKELNILQIAPSEFVMIGNSLKSDIQPVLSLGGYGIHIPFEVMWKHEVVDTFTHDHLKQVKRFDELLLLF